MFFKGLNLKIAMTTAAIAALIAGSAAFTTADASPIYLKVAAGQVENAAVSGIDLNGDLAYEGDVGTAVGPVRVEVGVARVSGSFGSFADVNAWDFKATGYLDLPLSDNSGVFLGAGVDRVEGQATAYGSSLDASGNGYHWTVGAAHRFSPGVIGEVAFTRTTADLDSSYGSFTADFDTVMAGVRVSL